MASPSLEAFKNQQRSPENPGVNSVFLLTLSRGLDEKPPEVPSNLGDSIVIRSNDDINPGIPVS